MSELLLELEGRDVSRVEELHLVEPAADVPRELGRVPVGGLCWKDHVMATFWPTLNRSAIFDMISNLKT